MIEPPRKQFGLRSLFAATAGCAALFAAFRWLGVPPRVSLFIAGLLVVSLIAAIGLVVAIGRESAGDK